MLKEKEAQFLQLLNGNEEAPEYEYDEFDEVAEEPYTEPEYKVREGHKYYSPMD